MGQSKAGCDGEPVEQVGEGGEPVGQRGVVGGWAPGLHADRLLPAVVADRLCRRAVEIANYDRIGRYATTGYAVVLFGWTRGGLAAWLMDAAETGSEGPGFAGQGLERCCPTRENGYDLGEQGETGHGASL